MKRHRLIGLAGRSDSLCLITTLLSASALAAFPSQDPVALADPRPSPVVGVTTEDGALVLALGDDSQVSLPDGAYANETVGATLTVAEGRPVAIELAERKPVEIASIAIEDGTVGIFGKNNQRFRLPEGSYELGPSRTGHPALTGFMVRNGKITGVYLPQDLAEYEVLSMKLEAEQLLIEAPEETWTSIPSGAYKNDTGSVVTFENGLPARIRGPGTEGQDVTAKLGDGNQILLLGTDNRQMGLPNGWYRNVDLQNLREQTANGDRPFGFLVEEGAITAIAFP